MEARVKYKNLDIDLGLHRFIVEDVLPQTGINEESFWDSFQAILKQFIPLNQSLLETRVILQKKLDDWHRQNQSYDPKEYKRFLKEIGYLVENLIVSTHFMESLAEREWIDKGEGEFKNFFKEFFPHIPIIKPLTNAKDFLKNFISVRTLFTHAVFATKEELEIIKDLGGVITHCPVSNRLLNNKTLNLNFLEEIKISYNIGTDGLSSNISLNMWDELREALFIHSNENLLNLSKKLLKAATKEGAKALGFNSGVLEVGKRADIIAIKLPDSCKKEDLAYQLILHTKEVEKLFIDGEEACPIS